jgi:hypothetical protein
MNNTQIYWYGRGYYDGRHHGYEASLEFVDTWEPEIKAAYKRGYDCGVADYCEMDVEEAA